MRIAGIITLFILLLWPAAGHALDVTVKVSSQKMDFGLPYAPENLLDGDTATPWVGGGVGAGPGQWIDLFFDIPVRVEKLGLFNGNQADGQFREFRRIRSGRIVYPDGVEARFWLRDEPGEQIIECRGKPFKSLRILIDDVFPKGELTGKMKVAVSEIKLYLSLMAHPDGDDVDDAPDPDRLATPPPVSADMAVPEDIVALLREYYVRQTSLSPDYAELFAEDVRDRNDFTFEVFKEMQRQRGTFKVLRTAQVNTDGLGFELVRREGSYAEVRVFGAYRVKVADIDTNMEEDSIFVVSKEPDGWKILELDGQEELF